MAAELSSVVTADLLTKAEAGSGSRMMARLSGEPVELLPWASLMGSALVPAWRLLLWSEAAWDAGEARQRGALHAHILV